MDKKIIISAMALFILVSFSFISAYTDYSESRNVNFYLANWTCNFTATTANWFNVNSQISINAMNNCSMAGYGVCCPQGWACNSSNSCYNAPLALGCSSAPYNQSAASCNSVPYDGPVAKRFADRPDMCGNVSVISRNIVNGHECISVNVTNCLCKWINNQCTTQRNLSIYNAMTNDPQCLSNSGNGGWCETAPFTLTDNCNTTNTILAFAAVTSHGTPSPACEPSISMTYPCVSTAKLGFFSMFNFVIALLVVVMVYTIVLSFRKKR